MQNPNYLISFVNQQKQTPSIFLPLWDLSMKYKETKKKKKNIPNGSSACLYRVFKYTNTLSSIHKQITRTVVVNDATRRKANNSEQNIY